MRTLLRSTAAFRRYAEDAQNTAAPHTVLILFPDGELLRTLLKECAKAFFGAEEGTRVSRLIDGETYSDCLIYPRKGEKLSVDAASAIIDESLLRPVEGEKKLIVIDGFQTASQLVQNKLLKVLEEPPAGVWFLLGATAEHAVLPTVLSRAVKMAEPPFSEKAVLEALRRGHVRTSGLEEAAAASGGIYSVAETLISDGGEEYRLAEDLLLLENPEELCRKLGERKECKTLLSALGLVIRDAMLLCCGQAQYCVRRSENVQKISQKYHMATLLDSVELLAACEREIQFNANAGQAFLSFALRMREEEKRWQKLS